MTKAYDFADLMKRLKGRGLDLAEDAAMILKQEAIAWLIESAKVSATPFDDMVVAAVVSSADEALDKAIDKIDGKEG